MRFESPIKGAPGNIHFRNELVHIWWMMHPSHDEVLRIAHNLLTEKRNWHRFEFRKFFFDKGVEQQTRHVIDQKLACLASRFGAGGENARRFVQRKTQTFCILRRELRPSLAGPKEPRFGQQRVVEMDAVHACDVAQPL